MRIRQTPVYTFEELSDKAKERAREWYRDVAFQDGQWHEFTISDAVKIGELLGISFLTHDVPLHGGKKRAEPNVWFNLSYSQSDGACIEGTYSYGKGSVKAIRSYAPQDNVLARIASTLADVQKRYRYRAALAMHNHGNSVHAYGVQFDDIGERPLSETDYNEVVQALRDFMNWIYKRLREEFEYQNADEQIDEAIINNEYEFTEDGTRA